MNDYTYQVLDPKDVYIDNGVGQTIGYMQPSTTTSVSTSSSPSTSTTITTTSTGTNGKMWFSKHNGWYSLGQEPNFTKAFRSGVNKKIKENILERMIDSLYA